MSAVSSRSEPARPDPPASSAPRYQRCDGRLGLRFARKGNGTVLVDLAQHSPCRALFPRPRQGEPPLAMLVNTAGGFAGGDRISVTVSLAPGAAATLTSQAADKVYRSLGPDVHIDTRLEVGDGAQLGWLPQETILFDGARLDRSLTAAVAGSGRLLACEMLVFGRTARGESLRRGRLRETWRIEQGGRLRWLDRLGLSDDIGERLDGIGFGGARALATLVYVGADAEAMLPMVRDAAEQARVSATLVNGVLVARLLGREPGRVHDGLSRLIGRLRRSGTVPWVQ